MDGELAVRLATVADLDRVTEIITSAFAHDPLWERAMARPEGGVAHHAAFWRLFVAGALRYPDTWLASEGAAALWIPPGGTELTPEQEQGLADLAAAWLGPAAADYVELLNRFGAAHPHAEPHYYLTLLGTHGDHRGHGTGMRLLADGLERVDAEHCAAYLESSNPANDRRYASLGFEPCGQLRYRTDGPVVTTMWRPAR